MVDLNYALKKMGKAWFLSYYVHCNYDFSDYTYLNPEDAYIRTLFYDSVREYHEEILSRILKTSIKQLASNSIKISEGQIKDYINLIRMNAAA